MGYILSPTYELPNDSPFGSLNKRMMSAPARRLLSLAVALATVSLVSAQETLFPRASQTTNVGIVYDREVTGTAALHTNGFYVGFTTGKLRTYYRTSYWGGSLGVIKNPRERKTSERTVQFGQNSGSFVFGKQNALIPVRAFKGWKRYYSGKDRRRGVAVGTSLELGFTAGIVKPYILEIAAQGTDLTSRAQLFAYEDTGNFEGNPEGFTDRGRINGTGGLRSGWSGASIVPGINAKAAVHLDWGAFDEFVKALEAGIMIDAFPKAIPLLIEPANNTPLFVNFYVGVHLGKRR